LSTRRISASDRFESVARQWFESSRLNQEQARHPLAPATVKKLA
jgi:hypothetical protein